MKKITFLMIALSYSTIIQAQNVGIGTTTPTYPLTVISDGSSRGIVQKAGSAEIGFYVSNNGNAYVQTWSPTDLYFTTNNGSAKIAIANTSGFVGIAVATPSAQLDVNGTLRIRGNGAATGRVLTSDASGNATWQAPAGPGAGFRAELTSSVNIPAGNYSLVNFNEDYDDNFAFNAVTGIFTAPVAGLYHFTANIAWTGIPASTTINYTSRLLVEFAAGGNDYITQVGQPASGLSGYGNQQLVSGDYKLGVGDKVRVEVSHSHSSNLTLTTNGSSATRFMGYKVY